MSIEELDQHFLQRTLELATIRRGFCAPNPAVGAVIVANQKIIAEGYHEGPGHAHAEMIAIAKLAQLPSQATLYVSLEPCCHWGRTPPCTEAIIAAGIKRVVYGFTDPNPLVAGKGAALLAKAGIQTEYRPSTAIEAFYASYLYWQQTKKPYITAKLALTLDGKIAGPNGRPFPITGKILQAYTHRSRQKSDAILTTAKTIQSDDPQLNVRLANEVIAKDIYIIDSKLQLPMQAQILKTAKSLTLFHSSQNAAQIAKLEALGVRCVLVSQNATGLNLPEIIQFIGQAGVHDLWVEAGGTCFSALFQKRLLNRAYLYIAPIWMGQGLAAFPEQFSFHLEEGRCHWYPMGEDVMCEINW